MSYARTGIKILEYELKNEIKLILIFKKLNITSLPCKKRLLVSGCDATHCNKAKLLQTLFDWWALKY